MCITFFYIDIMKYMITIPIYINDVNNKIYNYRPI